MYLEIQTACKFAVISIAMLCSAGCTTSYMGDRGRDAADIFSATLGYGAGCKARVGPLQTGLLMEVTGVGLRAGDMLGLSDFWPPHCDTPASWDVTATFFNVEACGGGKTAQRRGKTFTCLTQTPVVYPLNPYKEMDGESTDCVERRAKDLKEQGYVYAPAPFFTGIEMVAALGPSIRVGFNPGELIDFILGWTTIDIFNDDLGQRKACPVASAPELPAVEKQNGLR